MLEIRTLEGVSLQDIESVFNLSFSDYYFPIHFTKEQLEVKIETEGGRLDLSVGVYDGDVLVGFILHFIADINGKKIIYNGGTGVVPSHRGQRLTTKMYEFIKPELIKEGVDKMILEVLTVNDFAIKVYERVGFKKIRTLNCYKGELDKSAIATDYEVKELDNYDWNKMQSFWDYKPTWQNSSLTLDKSISSTLSLGVFINNELVGYVVFNPNQNRLHQLAIDKKHRRKGLGRLLIHEVASRCNASISFINIDDRLINMHEFLTTSGMTITTFQYEMEVVL